MAEIGALLERFIRVAQEGPLGHDDEDVDSFDDGLDDPLPSIPEQV
jgi:hypothetical protein